MVTLVRLSPALLPRVAVALPLAVMLSITVADPDLWGHLRFGEDILQAGRVTVSDTYSFTSDRPWVNHEWLAEIALALAYRSGGAAGVATMRFAVALATFLLIWSVVRRTVRVDAQRAVLMIVAAFGAYSAMATARPQMFSIMLFASLLTTLMAADRRPRLLLWLPPLFAIWANLHGGWIVGAGVLALWTLAPAGRHGRSRPTLSWRLWTSAAAIGATLINPYGPGLWRFLIETVRVARPDISEWQPIVSLSIADMLPWVGVAGLAAFSCARRSAWRDPRLVPIVLGLAAASWRVQRLTVFFALAATLLHSRLVAGQDSEAATQPSPPAWEGVLTASPGRMVPPPPRPAERWIVAAIVVAASAAAGGAVARNLSCIRSGDPRLADVEAASFIAANRLNGRMLTWFVWGEYAIWHFGPRLKVSMDGRRETVYSERTIAAHLDFYGNGPTGAQYVRELSPDYAWLPADLPVVAALPSQGWVALLATPRSVVFGRERRDHVAETSSGAPGARCFPDTLPGD